MHFGLAVNSACEVVAEAVDADGFCPAFYAVTGRRDCGRAARQPAPFVYLAGGGHSGGLDLMTSQDDFKANLAATLAGEAQLHQKHPRSAEFSDISLS